MTEDETFIRAIVDAPGDDLPRLVYADWLDDRGDPRGAYLRAECEWGRLRRSGRVPGDDSELRKLAAALDPVWVARTSRPPMGVCFATPVFRHDGGAPASAHAIDAVAGEFGIALPPAYRAFLLNYNGGWFSPFPEDEAPDESSEVLCPIGYAAEFARDLFARCHESNRRCGLFPIGGMPGASGHNTLLGVGTVNAAPGKLFGGVFWSCRDSRPWTENGEFIEVPNWDRKAAGSLPELFAEWEQEALCHATGVE